MVASGTAFDFEHVPERRGSDSVKWNKYAGQDVLPLWIADMDFASPPPVLAALQARVARGDLGYAEPWPALVEAVQAYCQRHYDWRVEADWLVWLPGLVCGINLACRSVDGEVLTATPVYPPFLSAPGLSGRGLVRVSLREEGGRWSWDFAALEAAVTPATRLLLLCHPHNPVGRAWDADELQALAEFAARLKDCDAVVFSDYGKGGLTHIAEMIALARAADKIVLVDPKGDDYSAYAGATVITPNRSEMREVVGKWKGEDDLEQRAHELRRKLALEALLVTRSEEGMTLFSSAGRLHEQTVAREVYDVSGAGDTVIATLAVMLAHGVDWAQAIHVANVAAGVVVGKLGTAVATRDEINAVLAERD
mgnify:CR=1 FL=1